MLDVAFDCGGGGFREVAVVDVLSLHDSLDGRKLHFAFLKRGLGFIGVVGKHIDARAFLGQLVKERFRERKGFA